MIHIRPLCADDISVLSQIQSQAFSGVWREAQWQALFSRPRQLLLGIELQERLVGYAVFSYVLDEAELLQVCVESELRGQRLAEKLMHAAVAQLKVLDVSRMLLEVRASNMAARALYARLGFVEDGVRKNYYPTTAGREDAVLMSWSI